MMSCLPVLADSTTSAPVWARILQPLLHVPDLAARLPDPAVFSLLRALLRPLDARDQHPQYSATFVAVWKLYAVQAHRSSPSCALLRSAFLGSLSKVKWETSILASTTVDPTSPVV